MTSLKYLAIINCTQRNAEDADDSSLRFLQQLPEGLEDLHILWCVALTDENLTHLPTTLQKFELDKCVGGITEIGLAAVAQRCPALSDVSIADCPEASASVLTRFTAVRTLTAMDFVILDDDLEAIASALPELQTISIGGDEVNVSGQTVIDCFGQKSTIVHMYQGRLWIVFYV